MSEQTPSSPAPGWYPNPEGEGLRWWDGSTWTEHVHLEAPTPEPTPEPTLPAVGAPPGHTPSISVAPTPVSAPTGAPAAAGLPAASAGDGPTRIFGVRPWIVLLLIAVAAAVLLLPKVVFDEDEVPPSSTPPEPDGGDKSDKKSGDAGSRPSISILAVADGAGGYVLVSS